MKPDPVTHSAYRAKRKKSLVILTILLFAAMVIAAGVGAVTIPIAEVASILFRRIPYISKYIPNIGAQDVYETIILEVRLPRILLAVIIGGALAGAGATLQGLFGNPLADPYIMGISSGAALGATIAISYKLPSFFPGLSSVPIAAFLASIATMTAVYFLAGVSGRVSMDTYLLSGVVVSSFLWAVMSFIMMLSGDSLREIMMWLMGSLSNKGYAHVKMAFPYVGFGISVLLVMARDLNLICLGDDEARHLGVDPEPAKRIIMLASSLVTAASVSVGGIIGFVGLIVPHTVRMVLGPDHRLLLPASVIAGGIFLVSADTVARTLIAPSEIPVGVITALVGAPFFFYVLRRRKMSES
ncbi:MAG: iron chelate uptake ABC transporter family permease subunit [Firmicutes bacterium]|nr:iron chelate uptake ABC transporter family permease subunit [Bacillota bacterium]HXL04041.1 iron chelate uptake ABC transporter family permease subunit [Bacillota bacterium]